jgi:hypothetical protein
MLPALSRRFGKGSLQSTYSTLSAHGAEPFGGGLSEHEVPSGTRLIVWQPFGFEMENNLGMMLESGKLPPYEPLRIYNPGDRLPHIVLARLDLQTGMAPNVTIIPIEEAPVGPNLVPIWSQLRSGMGDVHLAACRSPLEAFGAPALGSRPGLHALGTAGPSNIKRQTP